ncbi:MAG: cellulose biosynthesis cyclic di-GMP-binding regulatory protein BcsB, partial [Gallionella sp.]|nr:cellulose biosynthesis cyclic di-GMP-binding regulatory protein BcsB [Gallionella sp.]
MEKLHDRMNYSYRFNPVCLRKVLFGLSLITLVGAPGFVYAKKQVQPAAVEVAEVETVGVIETDAPAKESPDEFNKYSYTLEELGALTPIELHTVDGRQNLSFSMRADELITAAKLRLDYAWSPALIPELSHLKVLLNDELMTSLPLPRENSNGQMGEVKLDPGMFIDFNKLTLNLIAHYTRDCEDPMHSTLWANISNQSKLDLTIRHLKLPNDLALLPAPFFDRLDNRKLILPVIFPAQPSNEVLRAAGVVSSWFGALSSYRGAQFPVLINTLPKGNGVVMVAGSSAPAGLDLPAVSGPGLAVITNPLNPNAKLLVVMGRNASELDIAAQALTLGQSTLTGAYVSVKQMADIPARKPYDAPNWIPTDRPVNFGELARPMDLQVGGFTPDIIKVSFNIPPDIFPWRSEGIPVDLHYRYTPRPAVDKSTLNVNINKQFVQALPLYSVPSKLEQKVKLPLMKDGKAIRNELVLIPHADLYGTNQLQLHYFFDYSKEGSCKDVFLNNERGVVDPESTIDFSSLPHYTALPNLRFFVNDGFPYTRMADLSETAVVMPNNAALGEMETYLTVMGRMGKVTGYPAIRHVVIPAAGVDENAGKDLILIGSAGNQPLLERWADKVHPLLEKGTHTLRLPGPFERLLSRWENRDLEDAMHRAGDLISKGDGGLGALVAFESPLKSGRSVVVFTGDSAEQISSLTGFMVDPKFNAAFHGDLVLQSGERIDGFQTGPTYYVGSLPWWTAMSWYVSSHPFLLVLAIGLVALLVAVMTFRYLRMRSAKR